MGLPAPGAFTSDLQNCGVRFCRYEAPHPPFALMCYGSFLLHLACSV